MNVHILTAPHRLGTGCSGLTGSDRDLCGDLCREGFTPSNVEDAESVVCKGQACVTIERLALCQADAFHALMENPDCILRLYQAAPDQLDTAERACYEAAKAKLKNYPEVLALNLAFKDRFRSILKNCDVPILMGGDHSLAMASIGALLEAGRKPFVIWFDAHTDINTLETTVTGNIHGLPLAALMGYGREAFPRYFAPTELGDHDAIVIGSRDVDPPEQVLARRIGLPLWNAEDWSQDWVPEAVREVCRCFERSDCDCVHLSFDMDGIDPADAPSVFTPVSNGPRREDAMRLIRELCRILPVCSMDLVEFDPAIRPGSDGNLLAAKILGEFITACRGGYRSLSAISSEA